MTIGQTAIKLDLLGLNHPLQCRPSTSQDICKHLKCGTKQLKNSFNTTFTNINYMYFVVISGSSLESFDNNYSHQFNVAC